MTLFKEFNQQVQYGTSFGLPSHISLLYFEVTQVSDFPIGRLVLQAYHYWSDVIFYGIYH